MAQLLRLSKRCPFRLQRWIQHAALQPSTYNDPSVVRSNYVSPFPRVYSPLAEQEVRQVSDSSSQETPPYREEELLQLYEDLLALPDEPKLTPPVSTEKQDSAVVEAILSRLPSAPQQSNALSALLSQRVASDSPHIRLNTATLPHQVALNLLASVVQQLTPIHGPNVPLAFLSMEEWRSLTRVCLAHDDPGSAKTAVEFMTASGIELVEDHANDIIRWYAERGDVLGCEQFLQTFIKGPLTDHQRHLHIKAHEKSVPPGTIPDDALSLLHTYENAGRPAPMTAYSRLIAALFRTPSSAAHAQAWDLFAHMRYVAHPQPDAYLFTQMIHACAQPTPAEPERALDLFTEMTVDRRIAPTAGAYNAVILACARSGAKAYVNEAFRLAKEMLDAHRDARGRSAFRPDSRTFAALLEGAKRIGDLGRARWILAEMVEAVRTNDDVVIDERILTHVFHAYAAYRPPFKRSMTRLVDEAIPIEEAASSSSSSSEPVEASSSQAPSFAHLPPQSRAEVIGEARALFSRISPQSRGTSDTTTTELPTFPDVRLTPRLLNAYLSIFYTHASLEKAHETFSTVFAQQGVHKNAQTLVEALECCARQHHKHKHTTSATAILRKFADEAWTEFVPTMLENASARHIQRAYAARIRILALTGMLDEALDCLRTFVARYPPHTVRATATPPPAEHGLREMRETRVVLADRGRPLVRLTTPLDVQDDYVPPLLVFADVEALHHRLVAAGDLRGIAYVKWVCKAYEGALRRRREAALM